MVKVEKGRIEVEGSKAEIYSDIVEVITVLIKRKEMNLSEFLRLLEGLSKKCT